MKERIYGDALARAGKRADLPHYHLRDLESTTFRELAIPIRLRADIDARILPTLTLSGYSQTAKVEKHHELARRCLHNLILAGLPGGVVADTRRKMHADDRMRIKAFDAIEAAGLLIRCTGSEDSGKTTRYQATEQLLAPYREWPAADLVLIGRERTVGKPQSAWESLVMLKVEGEPRPFPKAALACRVGGISTLEYLRTVEDRIEKINGVNTQHAWQGVKATVGVGGTLRRTTFQPSVELRQIHSEQTFRYARNYTGSALSAQNLPKKQRRWLRIDGQKTAEFDYSGFHTRLLYHMRGMDPNPAKDIYRPRRILPRSFPGAGDAHRAILRAIVKDGTNICWNTHSRNQAEAALRKSIGEHEEKDFLAQVMRIEQTTPGGLIDRIIAAHPRLSSKFFTQVSNSLMTIDGWLMLRILEQFANSGKPALGIHDGVLCKAADAAFAEATMRNQYHEMIGYFPVIKQEF